MLEIKVKQNDKCTLRSFEKEEDDGDMTYYIGWDVKDKDSRITGLHITLHVSDDDVSGNVGVTYDGGDDDEADFIYEEGSGLGEDGCEMVDELLEVVGWKMGDYYGSESGMQEEGYANLDVEFEEQK